MRICPHRYLQPLLQQSWACCTRRFPLYKETSIKGEIRDAPVTKHASTNVIYKQSSNEWSNYSAFITALVETFASKRVCDVGGGANPVLPLEFIARHRIEYTLLDISAEELAKAPQGYRKIVQDIEAENLPRKEEFDFLVTKMMAEHIHNGRRFHKNVFDLLKPGGIAVHYFPTLYALPFIVNKIT